MTADQGGMFALARLLVAADVAIRAWAEYEDMLPFDGEMSALAVAVRETTAPQRYRAILEALTRGNGDLAVALWHGGDGGT